MTKVSLNLPPLLHQRLLIACKKDGKYLSQLVRELLDKALIPIEQARLKHMYEGLLTQGGFGPKGISNTSATIDEALYEN